MGRLIDADKLIAKIEEIYDGYMFSEDGGVVPKDFVEFLEEAPTVEAIPKADYEIRLKADIKAILVELQLEIEELNHKGSNCYRDGYTPYSEGLDDCKDIVQQKINSLKENT